MRVLLWGEFGTGLEMTVTRSAGLRCLFVFAFVCRSVGFLWRGLLDRAGWLWPLLWLLRGVHNLGTPACVAPHGVARRDTKENLKDSVCGAFFQLMFRGIWSFTKLVISLKPLGLLWDQVPLFSMATLRLPAELSLSTWLCAGLSGFTLRPFVHQFILTICNYSPGNTGWELTRWRASTWLLINTGGDCLSVIRQSWLPLRTQWKINSCFVCSFCFHTAPYVLYLFSLY